MKIFLLAGSLEATVYKLLYPFLSETNNNILIQLTDVGFLSNIIICDEKEDNNEILLCLLKNNKIDVLDKSGTAGFLQSYDMESNHVTAPYYSISKFAAIKTRELIWTMEDQVSENSKDENSIINNNKQEGDLPF